MDSKFIPTFFTVVLFVFVLYALVFMSPIEKIDSACAPVTVWPGKLIESGIRVGNPAMADKFARSVESGYGSCRRWLWNTFYDERYQQIKRQGAGVTGAATPTTGVVTPSSAPRPASSRPASSAAVKP